MFLAGSDDGVYHVRGFGDAAEPAEATKVLDSGRVMRLRQFDALDGVFAATNTGLYHSPDCERWTALDVPQEKVYAVAWAGDRLYAGTRPARLYATEPLDGRAPTDAEWRELDGFQDLPSRGEWRLPRHDDLAQVRDVKADPGGPERVVAGVEVGGVHISDDGGETWTERSEGMNDDVHELHVAGPETYVAATGFGLYRSRDAGRTWTRLDDGVEQRYFRSAFSLDGTVYAGAALSNSSTWNDDDADPEFFAVRDDALEPVEIPRGDETVTGMTAVDGALVVATHRGSLFVKRSDGWTDVGAFPVPGPLGGRYTPVTSFGH
jgi:hypothetical protein